MYYGNFDRHSEEVFDSFRFLEIQVLATVWGNFMQGVPARQTEFG